MSIMLSLKRRREVVQCLLSPHAGDSDLSTDMQPSSPKRNGARARYGFCLSRGTVAARIHEEERHVDRRRSSLGWHGTSRELAELEDWTGANDLPMEIAHRSSTSVPSPFGIKIQVLRLSMHRESYDWQATTREDIGTSVTRLSDLELCSEERRTGEVTRLEASHREQDVEKGRCQECPSQMKSHTVSIGRSRLDSCQAARLLSVVQRIAGSRPSTDDMRLDEQSHLSMLLSINHFPHMLVANLEGIKEKGRYQWPRRSGFAQCKDASHITKRSATKSPVRACTVKDARCL
ncbi:uncharacterized protein LAESUDRAFT_752742, partial [Laetiporus sulphureus 93-53]